jgi:uncharacterized damage-inducible protein DinB
MTNEPRIPTKTELLAALRASGKEVVERVGALPAESLEQGRYESGWNGRQILAHMASIEWTYAKLLDVAREVPAAAPATASAQVRRTEPGEAPGTPTRIAQGGIDSYNERQVAKRAEATVAELLEEFQKNRAATIAAVEAADDALLARPIRSAGGITGPLGGVLNAVAVQHVLAHANDIAGAG